MWILVLVWCGSFLKVIPSGHRSATWCYMVNASMWRLPTGVQKEWCVKFHCRNDKKVIHFNGEIPSFCNMM